MEEIHVRLLKEGTKVYRPVPAIKIQSNIYELQGDEIHHPNDEVWQFTPGTLVIVEEQNLSNGTVLVAIRAKE